MTNDLLFLDGKINIMQLDKLEWRLEDNQDVMENLECGFEGSVYAIKKSAVINALNDETVNDVRMGRIEYPRYVPIKSSEDFYKLIAIHIPLTEYCK